MMMLKLFNCMATVEVKTVVAPPTTNPFRIAVRWVGATGWVRKWINKLGRNSSRLFMIPHQTAQGDVPAKQSGGRLLRVKLFSQRLSRQEKWYDDDDDDDNRDIARPATGNYYNDNQPQRCRLSEMVIMKREWGEKRPSLFAFNGTKQLKLTCCHCWIGSMAGSIGKKCSSFLFLS